MVCKVLSLGLQGVSGYLVTTECDLSGGLPNFDIVGLPDTAVKEARDRVRAVVKNCDFVFPVSRITVNLAPADKRKVGTVYDLPILVGILSAGGQLPHPGEKAALVGELSLTGELRPIAGMLPMAMAAKRAGMEELYVPAASAAEATLAGDMKVYPVENVTQLARHLRGEERIRPAEAWVPKLQRRQEPDFNQVKGQKAAKRALEIAAAGGHNLFTRWNIYTALKTLSLCTFLNIYSSRYGRFFCCIFQSDRENQKIFLTEKGLLILHHQQALLPYCSIDPSNKPRLIPFGFFISSLISSSESNSMSTT